MGYSNDIKSQRWEKLDLLRFLCSALVVYSHTGFPGTIGYALTAISRIAVPLFFVISGFFFMNSRHRNIEGKRLKRTATLILMGTILFFLLWCFSQIVAGRSLIIMLQNQITGNAIWNMLVWNQPLFAEHLWYLFAYFCIILIVPVLKYKNLKYFGILFVAGNLLLGTYAPVLFGRSFDIFLNRNWLFTGIPFVCLGMIFFKHKDQLMCQNRNPIGLIILLFGICTIVEAAILRNTFGAPPGDIYISTLFLTGFVFAYALDNKSIESKWLKTLAGIGQTYSLWIYILHPFVSVLLDKALEILLRTQLIYTKPVIVYLITLILVVLFDRIAARIRPHLQRKSA